MSTKEEKAVANILLQEKAVSLNAQRAFTWASGLKSPIYCDNRILLSEVASRDSIRDNFLKKVSNLIGKDKKTFVVGVATAGISWSSIIADRLGLPNAYVRSRSKRHGKGNKIEGRIPANSKVIIIEDLFSTGRSALQAVEDVRAQGHIVTDAISIFTYGLEIASDNFKDSEVTAHSLTNYQVLLEQAKEMNYLNPVQFEDLKVWSDNQKLWSEKYREKNT